MEEERLWLVDQRRLISIRRCVIWDANSITIINASSPYKKHRANDSFYSRNKGSIDKSKRYILVVEDNNFSLSWVTTQISMLKLESVIAKTGKEAVQQF